VERREASAPEAHCGGDAAIAWRASRPERVAAVTPHRVARLVTMRLSALRPPHLGRVCNSSCAKPRMPSIARTGMRLPFPPPLSRGRTGAARPPIKQSESKTMPSPQKRHRGRRRVLREPPSEFEEAQQRIRAFATIAILYCESLPLWRVCKRAACRRNKCCRGTPKSCLIRGWRRFPPADQNRAWRAVQHGGPRHVPPATALEKRLRRYPRSDFSTD
jgi:hypothetical protein